MFKYIFFIYILSSFLYSANISLKKRQYFANGFNIIVDAKIKDVKEARVFFKDRNSKKYQLYIKMKCKADSCYGKLPLTKGELLFMDYIVASKDSNAKLERSVKYTLEKRDLLILPSWQNKYYSENFELYTELKPIPKYVRGIGDNLNIKSTSDENIWGVKLNLYKKVQEDDECDCKNGTNLKIDKNVDKGFFNF